MEKFPEFIKTAIRLYVKMNVFVEKMYQEMKDKIDIDHDAMLLELDHYVQAILLRVAISDGYIDEVELSFLKNIALSDYLFKDLKFIESGKLSKDEIIEVTSICDEVINRVPFFVELSVLTDKYYDSLLKVLEPTHCQVIYDNLIRIANYLKYVDGELLVVEDKTARDMIKTVRAYYLSKYVTFARKREKGDNDNE